jgi:uncharacterized membrane protein YgcG
MSDGLKVKPARAPKCPSCGDPITGPALECPMCNLSLRRLDAKFGTTPRRTKYLTDRSARLPLRTIKKLREELRIFETKFPQSRFSVFITDQLRGGSISEYTFWLANRARFSSIEAVGADNFDLLLGIDLHAGAAALTIGYGLEEYIGEDDLHSALAAAKDAFAAQDFALGVRQCIEFMTERMRDIARNIEQLTTASAPASPAIPSDDS